MIMIMMTMRLKMTLTMTMLELTLSLSQVRSAVSTVTSLTTLPSRFHLDRGPTKLPWS